MNKITPPHALADEVLDVAAASAISVMNCSLQAPAERADEALDAEPTAFPTMGPIFSGRAPADLSDEVLDAATNAAFCIHGCGPSACYGRVDRDDEVPS